MLLIFLYFSMLKSTKNLLLTKSFFFLSMHSDGWYHDRMPSNLFEWNVNGGDELAIEWN